MNLLRKPSCGARLCLRRRGRLANRRPLRHPRLAASATGGASAAMPDTLRVPRLRPQSLRKTRDTQTLVSLFWQGQKDLNPRHAVLEWMWEQTTGSGVRPVSPGSCRKSQNGQCWFGAAWKNPAAESVERPGKGLVHIVSHEIVRRAGRYVVERLYPLAVNGGRVWVSHARPKMHRIIPGAPLE